jgi:hypothetical protein
MRHFLGRLCAIAALAIASDSAAPAADSDWPRAHNTPVAAPTQTASVACLGGVLNERPTGDYLTVADYPAFAALAAGLRHILICGDSIPAFLPSSQRVGFTSRHR